MYHIASISRLCTMYAVIDGHGGKLAAGHCVNYLASSISRQPTFSTDLHAAIEAGVAAVHTEFCARTDAKAAGTDGACVTLLIVRDNIATVANIGDCRAVLLGDGGRCVALTTDHKMSSNAEKARIRTEGGAVALSKLEGTFSFSRSIGDARHPLLSCEPDCHSWELGQCDKMVVLATDGLWDVLPTADLPAVVRATDSPDPQTVAQRLLAEANLRGSTDNATVVCVDLRQRNAGNGTPTGDLGAKSVGPLSGPSPVGDVGSLPWPPPAR